MIATSHRLCLLLLLPLIGTCTEVGSPTDIEGRVKKYSYYYISRKLYYIPLFFVVYWAFYVFWLIVQSIARHKVETPLHWDPPKRQRRTIDALKVSVMDQIESFRRKFLYEKRTR